MRPAYLTELGQPHARGCGSLAAMPLAARISPEQHSAVLLSVCSIGAFDRALTIGSNLRMTVLDPTRQMEFDYPPVGDHIFVRLPLAGRSETWIHQFKPLARTKDFWADVQELPDGTVLTVKVPAAASREETAELLDGALRLIDEAQALVNTRRSASAATEHYIRDWWESRKQSPRGSAAPD